MSDDLVDLVGAKELADTVRRKHPETGQKINKLRKSYENNVKDFKGRNKPVSNERQLFNTLTYPDDEWEIQQVQGKEMEKVLTSDTQALSSDMEKRLDAALVGMAPGPLPAAEREKWRTVLNLEPPPKAKQADVQAAAATTATGHTSQYLAQEPRRPKRQGTKRRYDDDAFEGYAEGFADDGYEDSEEDRRSSISGGGSRKRRRKVSSDDILASFYGTPPEPRDTATPTPKPERGRGRSRKIKK